MLNRLWIVALFHEKALCEGGRGRVCERDAFIRCKKALFLCTPKHLHEFHQPYNRYAGKIHKLQWAEMLVV